jgi:hypothetical protein
MNMDNGSSSQPTALPLYLHCFFPSVNTINTENIESENKRWNDSQDTSDNRREWRKARKMEVNC